MKRRAEMPDEIRDKCLKIIAGSCELDVKELYQTYMDTYDDNTEYYDYIKPEADEE